MNVKRESMLIRRSLLLAGLLLAGCASVPTGPEVMALPGTGKSFDEFRGDDLVCRDFALQQIGGKAGEDAANREAMRNAAVGTVIGTLAGAVIGGREGAAVGAGSGLLIGSVAGSEKSLSSSYGSQRRYDIAYTQCMYAKGHRVPLSGHYSAEPRAAEPRTVRSAVPPPPPLPPPPVGSPPLPPAR